MTVRAGDLDRELDKLATLSKTELGERWVQLTARPLPRVSAQLLRLALSWELQAAVHGGLSRQTQQRLDQLAAGKTRTRSLQPGMQLVREHEGKLHVVKVADDGTIWWNERCWQSLSAVARAITGTRWSGPAFFGLKERAKAA